MRPKTTKPKTVDSLPTLTRLAKLEDKVASLVTFCNTVTTQMQDGADSTMQLVQRVRKLESQCEATIMGSATVQTELRSLIRKIEGETADGLRLHAKRLDKIEGEPSTFGLTERLDRLEAVDADNTRWISEQAQRIAVLSQKQNSDHQAITTKIEALEKAKPDGQVSAQMITDLQKCLDDMGDLIVEFDMFKRMFSIDLGKTAQKIEALEKNAFDPAEHLGPIKLRIEAQARRVDRLTYQIDHLGDDVHNLKHTLRSTTPTRPAFLEPKPKPKPKIKRKGWVNLYVNIHGQAQAGGVFEDRAAADNVAKPHRTDCVQIEWEE